MFQNMLIDLDKEGYAHTTISGVNTWANMIFKYGIRNKLMKDNPRIDAIIPKKAITIEDLEKNTLEETYFEQKELLTFLDAVLKIGLELNVERFYTLAFSGMRPGELVALKKSDLDFENKTIRISKTLYSENNNMKEYGLETTKTNKARTMTPHSFRHTHISMMTEAGVDLHTMKRIGHEDPDTTLKVYTHVTEKMKIKSINGITSMNGDLLQKLSF
ncbi:site-specific integrase [Lentibacillus sp. Marseille-P4043]|uniref:site-specific integrase n=1 Tax=Lentibacillus sp. Marseille-P4043 TaxID=2040293 RepID=UPI000D0ABE46|nr:site-specific integrase [Lentibacillus sp. Marseille-P4043]